METEYSIDDIFDTQSALFTRMGSNVIERLKQDAQAKSKSAGFTAHGSAVKPFLVKELNTVTCLLYREVPLPW